ncbi:MAG: TIR domain-containing protein [Pseudomonadota bacterium]
MSQKIIPKVFICYRRRDSGYAAKQIYDYLQDKFGEGNVEFDISTIPAGEKFKVYLGRRIDACDVVLVIIGDHWLTRDENNNVRLYNEEDDVRFEIERALKSEVPILPILVGEADMPSSDKLPESLQVVPTINGREYRQALDSEPQLLKIANDIQDISDSRRQSLLSRSALVVGMQTYSSPKLDQVPGALEDAYRISNLLKSHASGNENFRLKTISNDCTKNELKSELQHLFNSEVDVALFYFAGRAINEEQGYLVTQDYSRQNPGYAIKHLVDLVNKSQALEKVIILDCCAANQTGELFERKKSLELAEGVSILAIRRDEPDVNKWETESATTQLCDVLEFGGADLTGSVTIVDLYNQLNASGAFRQKLYFRANLAELGSIREATPVIDKSILANIRVYFPGSPNEVHQLSPAYEPEAEPFDDGLQQIFAELQSLNRVNLVEPTKHKHMYHAAMEDGSCQLTKRGRQYWLQSNQGRFGAPTRTWPNENSNSEDKESN